ncbi:MAG: tyrosine-type recombinase/integrase [Pseudomonadota bacterium]
MRRGIRMRGIIHRRNADGSVRVYHRAPDGTLTRLPALPENDPRFLRAYADAAEGAQKAAKGTVADLVDEYTRSREWAALGRLTREQRERFLLAIRKDRGAAPIIGIRAQHIRQDLADMPPHNARHRLTAWRTMLTFAVDRGKLDTNPARDVRVKLPKSEGFPPWSRAEIAQYREVTPLGSVYRLAFELALWVGCRRSDLCRLGWQMVDKRGWLSFRQQKTGGLVEVPFSVLPAECESFREDWEHLQDALTAKMARMLWLETEQGKPRSPNAITNWFAYSVRKAGIEGRSLHGLRKSRAIALGEAGWSELRIKAWTGHESLEEVQHYTLGARNRALIEGNAPSTKTGTSAGTRSKKKK